MSAILEVGVMEFVVGPASLSAITLAPDPDRYRSGSIAGVATAAAAISAADRNLAVVIQFLHWTYEKPRALALIWKWRDDRTIEVTFLHFAPTPREVGRLTLANAALLVKQNDYARSLHSEF